MGGRKYTRTGSNFHLLGWTKIVETDIKINAAKFRFAAYDSEVTLRDVDLYSLMVHEFGHALGLAHVNLFESVMNPELAKEWKEEQFPN